MDDGATKFCWDKELEYEFARVDSNILVKPAIVNQPLYISIKNAQLLSQVKQIKFGRIRDEEDLDGLWNNAVKAAPPKLQPVLVSFWKETVTPQLPKAAAAAAKMKIVRRLF